MQDTTKPTAHRAALDSLSALMTHIDARGDDLTRSLAQYDRQTRRMRRQAARDCLAAAAEALNSQGVYLAQRWTASAHQQLTILRTERELRAARVLREVSL